MTPAERIAELEAALAAERAKREAAVSEQVALAQQLAVALAQAAATQEECAKHCEVHARTDQSVTHTAFNHLIMEAREIRSMTIAPEAGRKIVEDARRFEWYFGWTGKGENFVAAYMQGMREHWNLDQWRAAIDAALRGEEEK